LVNAHYVWSYHLLVKLLDNTQNTDRYLLQLGLWKQALWVFRLFLVPVNLKAAISSISARGSYVCGLIHYYLFVF